MGEWVKKIGEFGEQVVDDLFEKIGWIDAQKGVELICNKPEKHKISESGRTTHGIDKLFSYVSPLIDEQLDIIVVSVKYTTGVYGKNPVTKFKPHFHDLAQTMECFKTSQERQMINNNAVGVSQTKDIGVLFWLSNDKKSDDEVISKVSNAVINDEDYDVIYLVDNKRAAFLYYSIEFVRTKFPSYKVEFYYHETGKNINPATKKNSGKVLPVQFINSSILTFRVESKSGEASLVITVIENFDKGDVRRLMGLAQQITHNWAGKVYIAFPDYNSLDRGNEVSEVKQVLTDKNFTERVYVMSYKSDFRNTIK
jgi:hypothetical protein